MRPRKLIDVTVDPITDGIFHKLSTLDTNNSIPFLHVDNDYLKSLEASYYLNRSGGKQISPYVQRILELADEDTLTDTDMTFIGRTIMMESADEWARMCSAFMTTYDTDQPQVETRTREGTETTAHTGTDTDTREPDLTHQTTRDKDKNVDETDYLHNGFNSVNASPVDKRTEKHEEDVSTTETGTDTTTHEKDTSDELTLDTTETVSRSPSAKEQTESLKYQIEFWHNIQFMDLIYNDIDKILTCPIYL